MRLGPGTRPNMVWKVLVVAAADSLRGSDLGKRSTHNFSSRRSATRELTLTSGTETRSFAFWPPWPKPVVYRPWARKKGKRGRTYFPKKGKRGRTYFPRGKRRKKGTHLFSPKRENKCVPFFQNLRPLPPEGNAQSQRSSLTCTIPLPTRTGRVATGS